jgi:hypothetical protein
MSTDRNRVTVIDHRSGKKYNVLLPNNVPLERLRPALIKQLGLTPEGDGGATQDYDLSFETGDGTLRMEDNETLSDAGVQDGAIIRITPRMRAG